MEDITKPKIYYATQEIVINDTRDYEEQKMDNIKVARQKVAVVFGVTGQDGSYLSELLLDRGYNVVGVKRRTSTDNTERTKHISSSKFTVVEGDVTDSESVAGIIKEYRPTHIFNLAAQSHVGTSFKQPLATWDSTATGVLNILNAIKNNDPLIRFYQASTSEMFGKNYSVKYDSDIDADSLEIRYQNEDTPFSPQSPYAVAKVAAHNLVTLYRDAYGIFACSGILFNHESPRRGENFVTRKITKYVAKLKEYLEQKPDFESPLPKKTVSERFVEKYGYLELGNIHASRDWGHARDYCEGMILMLEAEEPDDYVLATGETYTVVDLLNEAFGFEDHKDYVRINPDFYRPAEVEFLRGDATKAREKLGWKPKTTFKQLVEEMVQADYRRLKRFDYYTADGSEILYEYSDAIKGK